MTEFLFNFVRIFFDILTFAILVRIILSWVAPGPGGPLGGGGGRLRMLLHEITEPVLGPFRRIIPRLGMIDISPIVALFALDFLKVILLNLIVTYL